MACKTEWVGMREQLLHFECLQALNYYYSSVTFNKYDPHSELRRRQVGNKKQAFNLIIKIQVAKRKTTKKLETEGNKEKPWSHGERFQNTGTHKDTGNTQGHREHTRTQEHTRTEEPQKDTWNTQGQRNTQGHREHTRTQGTQEAQDDNKQNDKEGWKNTGLDIEGHMRIHLNYKTGYDKTKKTNLDSVPELLRYFTRFPPLLP